MISILHNFFNEIMCTYLVIFLNNFLETYENDTLKLLPKCMSANDDFKMGVVSLL